MSRTVSSNIVRIIAVAKEIVASEKSLAARLLAECTLWISEVRTDDYKAAWEKMTVATYKAVGVVKGDSEYTTLATYFSYARAILVGDVSDNVAAQAMNVYMLETEPRARECAADFPVNLRKLYEVVIAERKANDDGAGTGGNGGSDVSKLDAAKKAYKALSKSERSEFMGWAVTVK